MSQQRGANPVGLIFVDEPERDLGLAWFDDVIAAADQGRAPVLVRDRGRTLERLLAEGTGPAKVQISKRRVGILESDLEKWLNTRRRPAPGEAV
jgi:hypothetical protein